MEVGAAETHVALISWHLVSSIWSPATEPHVAFVDEVVVIIVRLECRRSPSEIDIGKCPRRPSVLEHLLIACNNIASGPTTSLDAAKQPIFSGPLFVITNTTAASAFWPRRRQRQNAYSVWSAVPKIAERIQLLPMNGLSVNDRRQKFLGRRSMSSITTTWNDLPARLRWPRQICLLHCLEFWQQLETLFDHSIWRFVNY